MLKKTADTTASSPIGNPQGRKLFRVTDGIYAGRSVLLMATSPTTIALSWSDSPYTTWSSPAAVASDAADQPFDAVMEANGTIHLVYSEQTTYNLVTKKLLFSGGSWTAGSKVTIYSANPSYMPSIVCEASGKLWVSWSRLTSGIYYVQVKSSADSGATWGSGAADGGEQLASASWTVSRLVVRISEIYAFYQLGSVGVNVKHRPSSSGVFGSETTVTASGTQTDHWDVNIASDYTIGFTYADGSLSYRDFDGWNWGTSMVIDSSGGTFPQLMFSGLIPVVTYISPIVGDQSVLMYSFRTEGAFSTPATMDKRTALLEAVLLYRASDSSWQTATVQASSSATADVYHADSGAMIRSAGDRVYFGMRHRFRYLKILLSSVGIGGTVAYSYWDGTTWKSFTPVGGTYAFDVSSQDLLLWNDYAGIPGDWQAGTVIGVSFYWIKVEVLTAFTTGPIGSQITTYSDLKGLIVRR